MPIESANLRTATLAPNVDTGERAAESTAYPLLTANFPFLAFASPAECDWVGGECLPRVVYHRIEPGCGPTTENMDSQPVVAQQAKYGRLQIPLAFPVLVRGTEVPGWRQKIELKPASNGASRYHYCQVWDVYTPYAPGLPPAHSWDAAGYLDFLRRVGAWLEKQGKPVFDAAKENALNDNASLIQSLESSGRPVDLVRAGALKAHRPKEKKS